MWASFTLLMISTSPLYVPCEGTVCGIAYKSLKSERSHILVYFGHNEEAEHFFF